MLRWTQTRQWALIMCLFFYCKSIASHNNCNISIYAHILTSVPQASWQVSFDAVQLSLLEMDGNSPALDTGIETHKIWQQKFDVDPV